MKLWQILFDDHRGWAASILIAAPYPAFSSQDALDTAADTDEGQKFLLTECDLADFKTQEERDDYCCYLGNASMPFARENMAMRVVTAEEVLESGAKLRPANMDPEEFLREALDEEHNCRSVSCDICFAHEKGLYLWAGRLLCGATEAPLTFAAYEWINEGKHEFEVEKELQEQREELLEYPHVKCRSCRALNWGDDVSVCGNCQASLKRTSWKGIS